MENRRLVNLQREYVSNVSDSRFPGHFYDELNGWDSSAFAEQVRLQIVALSQRSIQFDLEHVDASVANALRRVLISEVPTIAIENVYVWNNTSVIHDEVLSHRLGLVPLNVDPRKLTPRNSSDQPTDLDTIVFRLNAKCERNPQPPSGATEPEDLYIGSNVYASQLEWVPQGEQYAVWKDNTPGPSNPNILLAKLRPGQEIEMELHAVKGIGSDHAKWSPVATASYRLMPHINLLGPIPSELCQKFASCFSPGVIKVSKNPTTSKNEVKVVNPRNDTVSREVLRHKEFENLVELSRIKDYFIFSIESESAYKPEELLPEAFAVLRSKIQTVRQAAASLQQEVEDEENERRKG